MSNPQTRSTLDETLRLLEDALHHFQALLENEASALKQHDNQALIDLIQTKDQHADKVEKLITQLQTDFGLNFDSPTDPTLQHALTEDQRHQLQQKIQTCHTLNQRNGVVIQTLLGTNTQLMNLLISNLSPSLYNATGTRTKTDPQTSSIAKA